MVELAFAIPIITVIFLVIIDVGLVVREHQLLQNAAREGARFSAQPANDYSAWPAGSDERNQIIDAIRMRVVNYLAQENIVIGNPAAQITVTQTVPITVTLPDGRVARPYGSEVTVWYDRQLMFLGPPLVPSDWMQISGTAVFRNLY